MNYLTPMLVGLGLLTVIVFVFSRRDRSSDIYKEIERRKKMARDKNFMARGSLIRKNLGDDFRYQDHIFTITAPCSVEGVYDLSDSIRIDMADGTTVLVSLQQRGEAESVMTYKPGEWESHFDQLFLLAKHGLNEHNQARIDQSVEDEKNRYGIK